MPHSPRGQGPRDRCLVAGAPTLPLKLSDQPTPAQTSEVEVVYCFMEVQMKIYRIVYRFDGSNFC